jgi:hypothetical protein
MINSNRAVLAYSDASFAGLSQDIAPSANTTKLPADRLDDLSVGRVTRDVDNYNS